MTDFDGGTFSDSTGDDFFTTHSLFEPNYYELTALVDRLVAYVGAPESDSDLARECVRTAFARITAYVGTAYVPPSTKDLAVLQVSAELFQRRSAPNGIAQFATPEGSGGVRIARDPMLSAYPLLDPYLRLAIG